MWTLIVYILTAVQILQIGLAQLTGDHVCQEEEKYAVNVTEYFTRIATVRNYKWCMHIPPRCSFYTNKSINDSRLVEKTLTRLVEKCCNGFVEKDNECVSACPTCTFGRCEGKQCKCYPGYKGPSCDTACEETTWGSNCKNACKCIYGLCNPKNGSCTCNPGWKGIWCDTECPIGFYGSNCEQKCACNHCNSSTGECEITTTTTISSSIPTTEEIKTTITETNIILQEPTVISHKNNGKFKMDTSSPFNIVEVSSLSSSTLTVELTTLQTITTASPTNKYNPESTITESVLHVPESESTTIITIHSNEGGEEINYLDDETHEMINDIIRYNNSNNNSNLFNWNYVVCILALVIVVVLLTILYKYRQNRQFGVKDKSVVKMEKKMDMSTVTVYSHSIFHTPLPDPPTFDNPSYSPIVMSPIEGESCASPTSRTYETRLVCNMNFHNQTMKETKEYVYDHPPPSRCISPPLLETDSDFSFKSEPLYDEIPNSSLPVPVIEESISINNSNNNVQTNSIYMNTFGKTKF